MSFRSSGTHSNESNTRTNGVRVVVTRDWLRLDLGNNRGLTCSYGSAKATGAVPDHVFRAWLDMVDGKAGWAGLMSDRLNRFADQLSTLWPEWNQGPDISRLTIGSKHPFKRGKRAPQLEVEVIALPARKGGNFTVRYPDGTRMLMAADLILRGGIG